MLCQRCAALVALSMCVLASAAEVSAAEDAPPLHSVEIDVSTGSAAAVVVPDSPLLITRQLYAPRHPPAESPELEPQRQATEALRQVEDALTSHQSNLERVVKLNWYLAGPEQRPIVEQVMSRWFRGASPPAVSFVVTRLPQADALVGVDAVALCDVRSPGVGRVAGPKDSPARRSPAYLSVLPAGGRVFVAGQAEPGEDMAEATRKTLQGLDRTLDHLGRKANDVAQLKCFVQSMDQAAVVEREIVAHFGRTQVPAVSLVEWRSSLPIEIELLAWSGPAEQDREPLLEYPTLPWLDASPLFSRVARSRSGRLIFFSDLSGPPGMPAAESVDAAFQGLRRLLGKTGGDLAHLAKATYYVTDDEISRAHNEIRPRYYDPQRPPAASKATVAGTGRDGVRYVMDMIAVPSSQGTPSEGPEHGHGLLPEEAAGGWISLFDGQSTLGWQRSVVNQGLLSGGTSTTRFADCELKAVCSGPATLKLGSREIPVDQAVLETTYRGPPSSIELAPGSKLAALTVRPLGLAALFNGRDLTDWRRIDRENLPEASRPRWEVAEGALRVRGGPGALEYTPRAFGNLVAQLDVRTRAVHSNGGFFFRAIAGDFMNGYEAQLHNRCREGDPSQPYRWATGAIDDFQNAVRLVSRDFQMFRLTVVADGPHLATWVNGRQTVDWTDDRPSHENPREGSRTAAGVLQIQAHDPATDYELRAVLARELE